MGIDFVASLKNTYGKFSVWGEADVVFARYLKGQWENKGVTVLTHDSVTLAINGVGLSIIGPHHSTYLIILEHAQ